MRFSPREVAAAATRAVRRMLRETFTGTAAELAYYGLLSAVPTVAGFVGIVGLLGNDPETTNAIARVAQEGASTEAGSAARAAARGVIDHNTSAGLALGAGLLTTLWIASVYVAAFRRAAYRVHLMDPGPSWRVRPLQMLLTFVGLVLLAVVAMALIVTERVMIAVGDVVGADDLGVTIWSVARWPLMLIVVVLITAGLYNLAPKEGRRLRGPSLGALAAVLAWIAASVGFEIWVGAFGSYDATYGALAGAVAFAVWLWISNIALLFGLLLDRELELGREQA